MPLNDDSRPTTPPQVLQSATSSTHKADQIAHRFFIKFLLIIAASRATAVPDGPRSSKVDKWFNLETPDTDIHRDHMRAFRTISALSSPPTLTLHVVLLIPELGPNRVLVAVDALDARLRIEPTPRAILLETWTLSATPPPGSSSSSSLSSSESGEVSLAAVYKHAIPLFRSLYTLCRQLPAAKLFQRYRQRSGVPASPQAFAIELRLQLDNTVLAFDASPSPSRPVPLPTSTHAFPALSTPLGSLKIAVRYLSRPSFPIDTLESLISDGLFNQDARRIEESVVFTPTVLAHRQRDSTASSPGSGAMAIRSSRVPPPTLPRHTRTISFPAVSGTAVPFHRLQEQGVSGSGSVSDFDQSSRLVPNTNSPRVAQLRPEALAFAASSSLGRGTPTRTGRESLDAIRTTSGAGGERTSPGTSSSPPSGISAPRPPAIQAFRSSTLVPSGFNSPSTSLRSLGLGAPGYSKPPSSIPHAIPEASGGASSRPWPTTSSSPQSGGLAFPTTEPPPFASTSVPRTGGSTLGALLSNTPRSGESPSSDDVPIKAPGKRYSSIFGHRRAPSTGSGTPGSTTAAASGELAARNSSGRPGGSPAALLANLPSSGDRPSSNLLEPTENEENISEFLREIDNAQLRRSSGPRMSESHSSSSVSSSGVGHIRRVSLAERRQSGRLDLPPSPSPRSPPSRLQELILTDQEGKEEEVGDAVPSGRMGIQISSNPTALGMQLQTMDDQFKKTLQGLKERRRVTGPAIQAQASPPPTERQTIISGTSADSDTPDQSRRPVPSFRTGAVRERDQTETELSNVFAAAPGDGTASDGSGYGGIVGRLDLDSPELKIQTPPVPRYLQQPTQVAHPTVGRNISKEGDEPQGRRSEDEGARYEGDSEGGATRAERTSRYTSVLRRDGTLRAMDPARTSSGSTTHTESSRARRSATGWPGSSSPPTQ